MLKLLYLYMVGLCFSATAIAAIHVNDIAFKNELEEKGIRLPLKKMRFYRVFTRDPVYTPTYFFLGITNDKDAKEVSLMPFYKEIEKYYRECYNKQQENLEGIDEFYKSKGKDYTFKRFKMKNLYYVQSNLNQVLIKEEQRNSLKLSELEEKDLANSPIFYSNLCLIMQGNDNKNIIRYTTQQLFDKKIFLSVTKISSESTSASNGGKEVIDVYYKTTLQFCYDNIKEEYKWLKSKSLDYIMQHQKQYKDVVLLLLASAIGYKINKRASITASPKWQIIALNKNQQSPNILDVTVKEVDDYPPLHWSYKVNPHDIGITCFLLVIFGGFLYGVVWFIRSSLKKAKKQKIEEASPDE